MNTFYHILDLLASSYFILWRLKCMGVYWSRLELWLCGNTFGPWVYMHTSIYVNKINVACSTKCSRLNVNIDTFLKWCEKWNICFSWANAWIVMILSQLCHHSSILNNGSILYLLLYSSWITSFKVSFTLPSSLKVSFTSRVSSVGRGSACGTGDPAFDSQGRVTPNTLKSVVLSS